MSLDELNKIARPYAKAAFEFALEHQQLKPWSQLLQNAAFIISHETVKKLLTNPWITPEQWLSFFDSILKPKEDQKNFLHLLIEYHRLEALPAMADLFIRYVFAHEKLMPVNVITTFALTKIQQNHLAKALEKYLKYHVELTTEVNPNILGGAIIRAGSLVIDASGRYRLSLLSEYLKGKPYATNAS